jgi:hypothetical protein
MIVAERSGANLLEYPFFPKNEFRSGEIIFDAALLPDPPEIPFDPFFQAYRWRITGVPDHGGIGYQMPDFTGPKLAIHNRREPYLQRIGYYFGDLFDRDRSAASDVYGLSV